jgi:hypothetical protein
MGHHTSGVPHVRPRSTTPAGVNPLAFALTIVAVGAIAFWGSHFHTGGVDDRLRFQDSLALPPAVQVAAGIQAPPVRTTAPKPAAPKPSAHASPSSPSDAYTISYGFDRGAANLNAALHDAPRLVVRSTNGGAIRTTKHAGGAAIGFPPVCAHPGTASCKRVVLETAGNGARLNPGSRRVQFGATLRMRADQTSDGENIVQKGFASGGSVRCDLHAGALSITVDGTVRGRASVPATLVVSNSDQLRIGGKGTSANNDEFDGDLDDVWVTIGS